MQQLEQLEFMFCNTLHRTLDFRNNQCVSSFNNVHILFAVIHESKHKIVEEVRHSAADDSILYGGVSLRPIIMDRLRLSAMDCVCYNTAECFHVSIIWRILLQCVC